MWQPMYDDPYNIPDARAWFGRSNELNATRTGTRSQICRRGQCYSKRAGLSVAPPFDQMRSRRSVAGANERSSLLADVAGYAEDSGTYGGYPTINLRKIRPLRRNTLRSGSSQ